MTTTIVTNANQMPTCMNQQVITMRAKEIARRQTLNPATPTAMQAEAETNICAIQVAPVQSQKGTGKEIIGHRNVSSAANIKPDCTVAIARNGTQQSMAQISGDFGNLICSRSVLGQHQEMTVSQYSLVGTVSRRNGRRLALELARRETSARHAHTRLWHQMVLTLRARPGTVAIADRR